MSDTSAGPISLRELMAGGSHLANAVVPEREVFALRVGGDRFAVETTLVHEIVRMPLVTPLPAMPPFVLGVCAHRGDVLPVVDLSRLLGRGEARRDGRSRIAIAKVDGYVVAFLVDSVEGLVKLLESSIQPTPLGASQSGAEYLGGVASDDLGSIALLDLHRLVRSAHGRVAGG